MLVCQGLSQLGQADQVGRGESIGSTRSKSPNFVGIRPCWNHRSLRSLLRPGWAQALLTYTQVWFGSISTWPRLGSLTFLALSLFGMEHDEVVIPETRFIKDISQELYMCPGISILIIFLKKVWTFVIV